MPKVNIPKDYQWCLLDESTAQDTAMVAPQGRWRAIHNLHTTAVSLLIPGNQVYQHFDEDGDARSDVYGPGNSGKLDAGQSILSSSTVTAGTTATGDTSDAATLVVTRNGVDVTSSVIKPTFNGITVATGDISAIAVLGEGAGLEQGDVITFTCTTATTVDIQVTVAEDDLQLADGIYQLKATTDVTFASILGADEIIYLNVSEFKFLATDGGNDAKVVAYFA